MKLSPEELERRLGVGFEDGHDNLDYLRYVVIETDDGKVFALVRHRGLPTPGTELCVSLGYDRPECELRDALDVLNLTEADLAWIRPSAE